MTNLRIRSVPLHIVNGYGRTQFTLEGTTPDALVKEQKLRFDPPISPEGNKDKYRESWRRLQFALDMASPYDFPRSLQFDAKEKAVLARFRQVAMALGDSAVINASWSFKATFKPGQEDVVDGKLPSNIEMAGFATFLRQCDVQHEKASFNKVQKILGKSLTTQTPEIQAAGGRILKSWRKARADMKKAFIDQLVVRRLVAAGQASPDSMPTYPWTPERLMKMFQYGELIHWGDEKEQLSKVTAVSPGQRRYIEFRFVEAAQYFGYFYVGITALIDRALADG